MDVKMLSQLSNRPVALDGGKRHLRLEGRCVVPARSSVHGLSCSRRLSPPSGRNSTYRPVQICGAGSKFWESHMKKLALVLTMISALIVAAASPAQAHGWRGGWHGHWGGPGIGFGLVAG